MFSVNAFSGESAAFPIVVDFVNGYAEGDMFTARSSTNTVENIGCGVRINDFNLIITVAFTNNGIFTKSAGNGTPIFANTFDNAGTVNADFRSIQLSGGGTHSGTFNITSDIL